MYVHNLCRSIIIFVLTFTLMLGIFTDNVMAADEPNLSGSYIPQVNTQSRSGNSKIAQSISKALPSLQLGDGASNGAKDAVSLLQKLLASLGRFKDSVNGEFSDKTEEAVKNYQKDKGIEQDGIVSENTWSKLGDDIISISAIITPIPPQDKPENLTHLNSAEQIPISTNLSPSRICFCSQCIRDNSTRQK